MHAAAPRNNKCRPLHMRRAKARMHAQCGCHGGEEQEQRASLSHVGDRRANAARMQKCSTVSNLSKLCVAASQEEPLQSRDAMSSSRMEAAP